VEKRKSASEHFKAAETVTFETNYRHSNAKSRIQIINTGKKFVQDHDHGSRKTEAKGSSLAIYRNPEHPGMHTFRDSSTSCE